MAARKKAEPKATEPKQAETKQEPVQETEHEKDVMINIGGLWLNESKKGDVYFTGYLNGARLLILPNNFKTKNGQPDFVMNVLPYKASDSDTSSSAKDKLKKKAQNKDDFSKSSDSKDDIPF